MPESIVFDTKALADAIQQPVIDAILKRLEEMPAQKSAGVIATDGGTTQPEVKTFGDWLLAVKRGDWRRLSTVYGSSYVDGKGETKAALAEGSGTTGGFTVPQQFIPELFQIANENALVRPRARKQPMSSRTAVIPFLDQTATAGAGKSNFYGGMVANWSSEGGAFVETEPTFRMMELNAHKLSGYTLSSTELLDDSAVALESLLTTLVGRTIAWYEDYAFLRGTGVDQPLGIQNAGASISVTRTAGGNSFEYADVKAMLKRLLPGSVDSAVWICHPFILPDLIDLQQTNNTLVTFIPNLRDKVPMQLMGVPVVFSEKMAAPGSAFDVALADFSYYVIGDRKQLNLRSSEHYKFLNGQITWAFDYRVDGQPWLQKPITLADNTNTVSPFVYLT